MIYLDNAATTAAFPEVARVVQKYMCSEYGNPSSLHQLGVSAEMTLRKCAKIISKILNCDSRALVFTSGGTESNNAAILNTTFIKSSKQLHFITCAAEHSSVLRCFEQLESFGHAVTYLPFDYRRGVDSADVIAALRPNTALVSIMMVNNELGTINPIGDIVSALRQSDYSGLIHCDATQAVGKLDVDVAQLGVDLLTASAHKFHGPKGVGLLVDKTAGKYKPLIVGGGQQANRRSGTENVPGIAGMAQALTMAMQKRAESLAVMRYLSERLAKMAAEIGGANVLLLSDYKAGAAHINALAVKGIKSEVLLHALETNGVVVSSGSACHSNTKKAISQVIQAIDLPPDYREGVIRISASHMTTRAQVERAVAIIESTIKDLINTFGGTIE
ncbi:MAG: cysteine desulfurase NifS [Clostridiales bacterium]|nr:MAG: cysteine desulfurase NifS [Clostridiales bacterium]